MPGTSTAATRFCGISSCQAIHPCLPPLSYPLSHPFSQPYHTPSSYRGCYRDTWSDTNIDNLPAVDSKLASHKVSQPPFASHRKHLRRCGTRVYKIRRVYTSALICVVTLSWRLTRDLLLASKARLTRLLLLDQYGLVWIGGWFIFAFFFQVAQAQMRTSIAQQNNSSTRGIPRFPFPFLWGLCACV